MYGPFTSDPKCHFDADNGGHFFLTILELDVDPPTGDFTGGSHVYLAVSKTSDPTGAWTTYVIDTTNDGSNGTPSHAGCPCLGDQPLIGADANGFYISTNEFPLFEDGFNGAMVYAMDKASPGERRSNSGVADVLPADPRRGHAYSVQPATTPPGDTFATPMAAPSTSCRPWTSMASRTTGSPSGS